MSVGKKILNWFKSKFSRFSKKADEFVDKFIDKKSDDIINKISEKAGVKWMKTINQVINQNFISL